MSFLQTILTNKFEPNTFLTLDVEQNVKIGLKSRFSKWTRECINLNQIISLVFNQNLDLLIKNHENIAELQTLQANLEWFKEKINKQNHHWFAQSLSWLGIAKESSTQNIDEALVTTERQIAYLQRFTKVPCEVKNLILYPFLSPHDIEAMGLITRADKKNIDKNYPLSTLIAQFIRELLSSIRKEIYPSPYASVERICKLAAIEAIINPNVALKTLIKTKDFLGSEDAVLLPIMRQLLEIDLNQAKKIALQIKDLIQKIDALKQIGVKQAKTDHEAAKLTFIEAKNTALQMMNVSEKATALREMVLDQFEVDPQAAKATLNLAKATLNLAKKSFKIEPVDLMFELLAIARVECQLKSDKALSTLREAKVIHDEAKLSNHLAFSIRNILLEIASLEAQIDKTIAKETIRIPKAEKMVLEDNDYPFYYIVCEEVKIDIPSAKETASHIQDFYCKTLALDEIIREEMIVNQESAFETLKLQLTAAVQVQDTSNQFQALKVVLKHQSKLDRLDSQAFKLAITKAAEIKIKYGQSLYLEPTECEHHKGRSNALKELAEIQAKNDVRGAKKTLELALAETNLIQDPQLKYEALRDLIKFQAILGMDTQEILKLAKEAAHHILDSNLKVQAFIELALEFAKTDKEAAQIMLIHAKDAVLGIPDSTKLLVTILQAEVKFDKDNARTTLWMIKQDPVYVKEDPVYVLEIIGMLHSITS